MNETEIIDLFKNITIWKNKDQRAPHKPLLLLFSLASIQRGESRLHSFESIEQPLKELLAEFGPTRIMHHAEQPFWRLQNDGDFWEIPQRSEILSRLRKTSLNVNVPVALLKSIHACGGFTPEYYDFLKQNPELVNTLATMILENHFPPSIHESILDAVHMPWITSANPKKQRSPEFRNTILRIYEYKCAVCGFDGRMQYSDLGLEAAHIKWHMAGGPDSENNGVALCVFHHHLFDRGAIGISDNYTIMVSQFVNGGPRVHDTVIQYSGKPMRLPLAGSNAPEGSYLTWHRKEVFKSPARAIA